MEQTLALIKPEAVVSGYTGKIINKIEDAGFNIVGLKMLHMSKEKARSFYAVHQDKAFFDEVVDCICRGSVVALMLEKENAVEDFRKLMGATNPAVAEDGTLRKLYGQSIEKNGIHGADSVETAQVECGFFFSRFEIVK